MTVGVKFCGHCNPCLDIWELYRQLCVAMPEIAFCFFLDKQDVDALLILNGCYAACCSRPDFDGPVISVSPGAIDHWTVAPESVLNELCDRLRSCAHDRARI